MSIESINLDDIKIISADFAQTFDGWSYDRSFEYLSNPFIQDPEYCLKYTSNSELAGGIFCKLAPYQKGRMLVVEALHILKEYRSKGFGRLLMNAIVELAKKNNIEKIGMLAPNNNEFPISWYKSIGFKETGWIEMEGEVNDIKI